MSLFSAKKENILQKGVYFIKKFIVGKDFEYEQ